MFWGLVLKTNKRYSQQVTKAFHVSQAVLDLNTLNANEKDAVVQVWLHIDDTDHLLANVSRQTSHVRLDLAFTEGETVAFYSKGNGAVHLSGYLIPDEDDFGLPPLDDDEGEEEEEEDEENVSDEEEVESSKKQKANKKPVKAAAKAEEEEDDDDESDDLDFDGLNAELEDGDLEDEEDSDDEDDDDDEDEDEDDDDGEDDEDDSDEAQAPPAKQAKIDKSVKQNGLANGKPAKNEQKQKNPNQKQEPKQDNQQQKSGPKTISSGVVIEDLRPGKGPEAKTGRKVSVYYEGRLKKTNKVFDSSKAGAGFTFNLGRGEVIRGWDIGVAGMKVGSKRRITCPPHVAYGAKGAPPAIPSNATLVFDVELRGVN